MARRRQPPLFEVLSGLDRRPSSGEGNVLGRRPVEVQPDVRPNPTQASREPQPSRASGFDEARSGSFTGYGAGNAPRAGHRNGTDERVLRIPVPALALGVAAVIVLLFILWPLAYSMGRKSAENELIPHAQSGEGQNGEGQNREGQNREGQTDPGSPAANDALRAAKRPASPGTAPPPIDPPGTIQMAGRSGVTDAPSAMLPSSGSLDPIRVPDSALDRGGSGAAPNGTVQEDPRQIGFNYLELCTLTYKDALQAVGYLGKNGIRASTVPARKGVDPATAAAKNQPHLVFVADGFVSDRFKASERDRRALETKVEQIGKKWQRDDRGPSDFSRPQWRLFKGKDKE